MNQLLQHDIEVNAPTLPIRNLAWQVGNEKKPNHP